MNNSDERDYEEEAANAALMEEQDYDPDLFADTWNAEPFDPAELNITPEDEDIPEWMIGSY